MQLSEILRSCPSEVDTDNGVIHLCPILTDEIRQWGHLLLPRAMDFPHHQEEEEEDEEEVGAEVEEEEEEEAGSWVKTKLSLLLLCCVVLCCVFLCCQRECFLCCVSCWHDARLSSFAVFDVIRQFAKLQVCEDTK